MKRKIPKFESYQQEAQWWDTHDVTEIEGLELVEPKAQTVSIRLERHVVDLLKQIAREQGISYTALVRLWVIEKLRKLQAADAKR